MKAALVTIHDDNYKALADITWPNKQEYAKRYGYDAIAKTGDFHGYPIGFEKIALLLELANQQQHEVFFWTGTDSIITNFHIPLDEFMYDGYHVVMAKDFGGINSDSIVIRNTPEGRAWLQMIMDKMPQYLNRRGFEQDIMWDTHDQYQHMVKIVPQRFMNSYWYPLYYQYYPTMKPGQHQDKSGYMGHWRVGDFLLHVPGQPLAVRLDILTQASKVVLR